VSVAALSGLESAPTAGSGGPAIAPAPGLGSTAPAVAAAERVRQLQTLLAEVERGPASAAASSAPTFASMLAASSTPAYASASSTLACASASSAPACASASSAPALASTSSAPAFASALDAVQAQAPGAAMSAGSTPAAYAPLVQQAAARYGIDPALLAGLIQQESGFDSSARSSAGALGLTQLMPSTAASLGVAEPLDPAQSIEGGARYLAQLLAQFGGNAADALAAYNAGPGAVQRYGGVPPYPETQQYVAKVLGYAASFRQAGVASTTAAPGVIA
jgi:soluble lytic murein transglycosylase-like protein